MTVLGAYKGNVRDLAAILEGNYQNKASAASGLYRATMPRLVAGSNIAAATSGVAVAAPIWLQDGDIITSLTWVSGATALATGTVQIGALYSTAATPALLGASADATSAAWAANAAKTFTLADPVDIDESGYYWASLIVAASTVPTLVGLTAQAAAAAPVVTGDLNLAVTHGSSLTAAPATIASPTVRTGVPLVIAR
ncbi:hypothetical protein AB1484_26920 [Parafrankia sp. FMc6]|uniref:hypothetical protein n=1 Tax=Parafrankia soli TaxID=2599596 RepID=UPI0034D64BF5